MHGSGGEQGGRWPVGLWFALVGVSAGTVTSFALIGWTFTRSLYGGDETAEPLEFESGTVVIEAEEEPVEEADGGEGAGPDTPGEPGGTAGVDPSPAEPRTEPMADAGAERADEAPEEPEAPVEEGGTGRDDAEEDGPELVPIEEDDPWCPPDIEVDVPDWDYEWRRDGDEGPWPRSGLDEVELPLLE